MAGMLCVGDSVDDILVSIVLLLVDCCCFSSDDGNLFRLSMI